MYDFISSVGRQKITTDFIICYSIKEKLVANWLLSKKFD